MMNKNFFYIKLSCPKNDDDGRFLTLFKKLSKNELFETILNNIPNNLSDGKPGDIVFIQVGGDSAIKKQYFIDNPEFQEYVNGISSLGTIIEINESTKTIKVQITSLKEVVTKEDLYYFPQFTNKLGGFTKGTPNQAGLYKLENDTGLSLLDYFAHRRILPEDSEFFNEIPFKGTLTHTIKKYYNINKNSPDLEKLLFETILFDEKDRLPTPNIDHRESIVNEFSNWFRKDANYKESYDGLVNKKTLLFWDSAYFDNKLFRLGKNKEETIENISTKINEVNPNNTEWEKLNRSTSKGAPKAVLGEKNYLDFLDQYLDDIDFDKYTTEFDINSFESTLKNSGLRFDKLLICRSIASLLTKPFIIFTGLSGSGKTKLAQAFVQWISQDESQYRIIPVGADWTNREPLLGYPNALKPEEYVKPDSGVLDLIIQANNQPDLPHFLILDEMNLSHVERYFADFLSVMESKEEISLYSDGTVENGVPSKLKVPSNLFVIGTVNIDETTNMFSPKVLDRANTIEFRVTKDEMKNFLGNISDINMDALTGKGAGMANSFLEMAARKEFTTTNVDEINSALVQFFGELKKTGAEFGYRSATEILRLINQLSILDETLTMNQKIDIAIIQKLLPKLHGSRRKLCPVLETLGTFCISGDVKIIKDVYEKADFDFNSSDVIYPLSLEKIKRMYSGAIDNGFASFAEA